MALVDRARREPVGPKRARSLVIQLWYPAAKGGPRVPYMSLAVARFVAKDSGVPPDTGGSETRRDGGVFHW